MLGIALLMATALTPPQQTLIEDAVRLELRDPDSAKFRHGKLNNKGEFCGFVNAKNGFGGYTGFTPFIGMIIHGTDIVLVTAINEAAGIQCVERGLL